MGTTPNGLPYPEPTDDLRQGAAAIQALAEALDGWVGDTGWLTDSSLYTPASGVDVSQFFLRRAGKVAMLRTVFVLPSLSGVTTFGDATNTLGLTLTDSRFIPSQIASIGSSGVGRVADAIVNTAGAIQVTAIAPDATQTGTVTLSNLTVSLGGAWLVD